MVIADRIRFLINRARERLWVKPLMVCLVSVAGAFLGKAADAAGLADLVPAVTADSITTLLSIMASSMLVIATFAVASMVSAYASASSTATPRSFSLVIADDVSQNALSTFIGAFIFSIVALIGVKNDFVQSAGLFLLFVITILVFGAVVLTFVRWVDSIARLGRLGTTIEKVEAATAAAMRRRRRSPWLRGVVASWPLDRGRPVYAQSVGYVQRVEVGTLQACAEKTGGRVVVASLPGTFATPGRPLAYVIGPTGEEGFDHAWVASAFVIGRERIFDEDPRFGLVVLSEIGDRALSPGINDPGTAIAIIGSLTRLLVLWTEKDEAAEQPLYDRVEVPELSARDMFDDAFTAIGRDGAGAVEVMVRLQKSLGSLATLGDQAIRDAALAHARIALARAEGAMQLPEDLAPVRELAAFAKGA